MRPLKPGDIVLVSRRWQGWSDLWPGNLTSWAISKRIQSLTKSRWNHVGLIGEGDSLENATVIEALDCVKERPLSVYLDRRKYRILILRYDYISEIQRTAMVRWAREQIGEPYNYWLIAKIRWVLWKSGLAGLKKWLRYREIDRAVWICSELVRCAYRARGIPLSPHPDAVMIPGDFARAPGMTAIFRN